MAADHALVDAAPTWALIAELRAAGFTKTRIAKELQHNSRQLQLGRRKVTVRNAAAMRRVHERLMASDDVPVKAGQTRQMISALRDEGYTTPQLLRAFGLNEEDLPGPQQKMIRRGVEKAVRAAFDRLTT